MGLLSAAFNAITRIHSQAGLIRRPGSPDIYSPMRWTQSNYFRYISGPSQTVVSGFEAIIPTATIYGQTRVVFTPDVVPTDGTFGITATVNGSVVTSSGIPFDIATEDLEDTIQALTGCESASVSKSFLGNGKVQIDFVGSQTVDLISMDVTSLIDTTAVTKVVTGLWPNPIIKRGDKIIDPAGVSYAIKEVIPMPDLGGENMGYRVRYE